MAELVCGTQNLKYLLSGRTSPMTLLQKAAVFSLGIQASPVLRFPHPLRSQSLENLTCEWEGRVRKAHLLPMLRKGKGASIVCVCVCLRVKHPTSFPLLRLLSNKSRFFNVTYLDLIQLPFCSAVLCLSQGSGN